MTVTDPVRLCLEGRLTPALAIAQLLLAGLDAATIARRVRAAEAPGEAWATLSRLVAARANELEGLRRMIDSTGIDHAGDMDPQAIAGLFDRAVAVSPEASVALYSLGDPAALEAATGEIVAWLDRQGLLTPDADVLDLGCGIGRMVPPLAPRVRSVLGVDVSSGMVAEARRRCGGLDNVNFTVGSGHDLAGLPDAGFDLVLAVDSFPYMVQAGVAEAHMAEARRVLRAGGTLVILNLSYRGDPVEDARDAIDWAERYGFEIRCAGASPFAIWDGFAYVFGRVD